MQHATNLKIVPLWLIFNSLLDSMIFWFLGLFSQLSFRQMHFSIITKASGSLVLLLLISSLNVNAH